MESWKSIGTSICMCIHLLVCLCICTFNPISVICPGVHLYVCSYISGEIVVSIWHLWVHTYIHISTRNVHMFIMACQICVWLSKPPMAFPAVSCPFGVLNTNILYRFSPLSHRQFHYSSCFFFLCVFNLFQVTLTTTTTLPVTVVCLGASSIPMTVTTAATTVDLVASDQHDVVLLPTLILRDKMGVLAFPHCYNNDLSPRCLLRLIPSMLWVLLR